MCYSPSTAMALGFSAALQLGKARRHRRLLEPLRERRLSRLVPKLRLNGYAQLDFRGKQQRVGGTHASRDTSALLAQVSPIRRTLLLVIGTWTLCI